MYVVAIVAHAVAGAVALVAGVVAIERPPRGLVVHVVGLVLMLGFLGVALAVEWPTLDVTSRVLFGALGALGLVVVARGVEALRRRPREGGPPVRAHRRPLRFTVVALTDAFLVVAVLDLGAPTWAVVLTGGAVAAVGHVAVGRRIADLETGATAPPPAVREA